jgi:myosin-5
LQATARAEQEELSARLDTVVERCDAAREAARVAGAQLQRKRKLEDGVTQERRGRRSFDVSGGEAPSDPRSPEGPPAPSPGTGHGQRQQELCDEQQQQPTPEQQEHAKQQNLREQRIADQARLVAALQNQELGFHQGRPVAAMLVFRCCLQWEAFQADRTSLFDDLTSKVLGRQVELHQGDNAALAYWLSTSVTLLYLMQTHVKPVSGGAAGGLFKQELGDFTQRVFARIRDNVTAKFTPHNALCIRPTPMPADPARRALLDPWSAILAAFDDLLATLRANFVPRFVVRKLLEQLFSFVNVKLFNLLLMCGECCSFSNGEYVKTGLSKVELWVRRVGWEFAGEAWNKLAHIRQAAAFFVLRQKERKSLEEIKAVCPELSVLQLHRLSTMYSDDQFSTGDAVSGEVLARMNQLKAGNAILLQLDASYDDTGEGRGGTATPFTLEEIAGSMDDAELLGELPQELRDALSFDFLGKTLEAALEAAS